MLAAVRLPFAAAALARHRFVRHVATSERVKFVDKVRVQVIGGHGGKGVISFEPVPLSNYKKRPIGGTGGKGGDVVIEASSSVRDLNFPTYVIRGHPGTDASGKGNNGRAGKFKKIMVPVGTIVKEVQRVYVVEEEEPWLQDDEQRADADGTEGDRKGAAPSRRGRAGQRGRSRSTAAATAGSSDGDGDGEDASAAAAAPPVDKLRSMRAKVAQEGAEADAAADELVAAGGSKGTRSGLLRANKNGLMYREEGQLLADLNAAGQHVLVARGGAAGTGNRGSSLTYSQQRDENLKPHVSGSKGEMRFLELELKTIADVGLVGFPNAGKSSFLSAISKAKPKVADYPFTTLHPHVGICRFQDGTTLSVADIPGLIEGAHADRGLGHAFLRHIERVKVLLYVIDASGRNPDPAGDLKALQRELRLYDPALPLRPSVVLANKIDAPGAAAGVAALRAATALPVLEASALVGLNIPHAMNSLRWVWDAAEKQAAADARAAEEQLAAQAASTADAVTAS